MLERQGAFLMLDQSNIGRTWLSGELEAPCGREINLQIATGNVDELYQRVQQAEANVFLELLRIAAISAADCRKLRQVNADNFGT